MLGDHPCHAMYLKENSTAAMGSDDSDMDLNATTVAGDQPLDKNVTLFWAMCACYRSMRKSSPEHLVIQLVVLISNWLAVYQDAMLIVAPNFALSSSP
ncbi:hypothetical protein GJAV_G00206200 [Gymnothorax javanicus]|nr:hypothetical protein GJAV_G00206200 [Gymnothorax javanicus]